MWFWNQNWSGSKTGLSSGTRVGTALKGDPVLEPKLEPGVEPGANWQSTWDSGLDYPKLKLEPELGMFFFSTTIPRTRLGVLFFWGTRSRIKTILVLLKNRTRGSWYLRSVPEAGRPRELVENHRRACTQVIFLHNERAGTFSLFRNSDRLADTFRSSEDPSYSLAGTFHGKRSRLLKTGFFRHVGAENTKEKIQALLFAKVKDCQTLVNSEHRHLFQLFS